MAQQLYRVVAALIRQDDAVLLVRQQGPADPTLTWALPGGVVADGELLTEALVREVGEETSLDILRVGPLAYLTHLDNPAATLQSLAFVFEIDRWRDTLHVDDPDAVVKDAQFLPVPEAIDALSGLPWVVMREPLITYLRGEVRPGSVWLYRSYDERHAQLIDRLEPHSDAPPSGHP